jgi:hypothetical protein
VKYLLTLWGVESAWSDLAPAAAKADLARWDAFGREASDAGVLASGEGLQPTQTATTLRVRDGEHLVTDGPFAETTEQLGGYYLLDCRDLDEAISWAKKIPSQNGSIEIRPVLDYAALGSDEPAKTESAARSGMSRAGEAFRPRSG